MKKLDKLEITLFYPIRDTNSSRLIFEADGRGRKISFNSDEIKKK